MDFRPLFGVFSRRPRPASEPLVRLGKEFRTRILLLCRDTFAGRLSTSEWAPTGYADEIWSQVHSKLLYLYGQFSLSQAKVHLEAMRDLEIFLNSCKDDQFLDFIEVIFQAESLERVCWDLNPLVERINFFLEADEIPLFLTSYVQEEITATFHGQPATAFQTTALPRIIERGDDYSHSEMVAPVLELLSGGAFGTANHEFREALVDFRKKDYGDCLTKCCSCLESVMKIICRRKNWESRETASFLIKTIVEKTSLESFFIDYLMIVATLRNKLSTAHGGGEIVRSVSRHVAKFAINSTASSILLLAEETS